MLDVLEVQELIIEKLKNTGEFRKVELFQGDPEDMQKGLTTPAVHLVYNGAELQNEAGSGSVKSIITVRLSVYLITKNLKADLIKTAEAKDMLKVIRQALHGLTHKGIMLMWQRESAVSIENRTHIYEQEYMYKDYLV